jgi:hypothetical protein
MKFNLIKTREEMKREIENIPYKKEILVNVCERQISVSRFTPVGYTIWWGGNYGMDAKDSDEVLDTLEMLTSFIIEGEFNKHECYTTRNTIRDMKENAHA